jgi:hypothetical protein
MLTGTVGHAFVPTTTQASNFSQTTNTGNELQLGLLSAPMTSENDINSIGGSRVATDVTNLSNFLNGPDHSYETPQVAEVNDWLNGAISYNGTFSDSDVRNLASEGIIATIDGFTLANMPTSQIFGESPVSAGGNQAANSTGAQSESTAAGGNQGLSSTTNGAGAEETPNTSEPQSQVGGNPGASGANSGVGAGRTPQKISPTSTGQNNTATGAGAGGTCQ